MPNSQLSEIDDAAIRANIDAYAAHAVAGDWDAWQGLFMETAVFMPPGARTLRGHVEIRSFVDDFPSLSTFNATPLDISGSGNLAVSRGEYSFSFADPDGVEVSEQGKFIWVWTKEPDDSWKITQDIWNTEV